MIILAHILAAEVMSIAAGRGERNDQKEFDEN